ncbi:Hypothetical predicted protein [Mytilus galloprovincialis]|uniref:Fibrinogen C-terminal domain-containing protein n=1 Tax=Mytilus galloprovincialis TaxID=29158 RepID=A0A8B6C152_MYTGA|nr:Hypothetical predicted protein [Mytilus galloprovincialis]
MDGTVDFYKTWKDYEIRFGELKSVFWLGDSLMYSDNSNTWNQNGMMFSTYDKDTDRSPSNCALAYKGALWYNDSLYSNLNGKYLGREHSSYADFIKREEYSEACILAKRKDGANVVYLIQKFGEPAQNASHFVLLVKGIRNLRVVDASVIRNLPPGNTHGLTVMIAEKASDLIKRARTF